jgi:hypothetical protein
MSMSKRLQIIVSDDEAEELRQMALQEGLTLSEWARRALRRAQQTQGGPTPEQKRRAVHRALTCGHEVADMGDLLSEIERGRGLR